MSLALSLSTFACLAHADEASAQRVEELKQRGNQAMMDLNYTDALAAYTAALALAPDDATLYYNLGRTHQAREDFPAALDALEQFGRKASSEVRARVPKLDQLVGDVRARVATVAIRCSEDIAEATLIVGDKTTAAGCTTAAKEVRVSVPGRHALLEVRLTAGAYQAQPARVAVDGGGPVVSVTLTVLRKATSGTLLVRALPASARIAVDGVARGNSPLEVPLPAGAHALDVDADGHLSKHVPILVDAGGRKEIDVELERRAPITTKWWFWTGVGVLAVGVGVGVWYLIAQPESSASRGTIAPGQVSSPLVTF